MSTTVKFAEMDYKEHNNFFEAVQAGEIICPEPILWNDFWKNFVKPIAGKNLMPLILSSWWSATDEEKNYRFKSQLRAIEEKHNHQEIFEFFSNYKRRNEWRLVEK
jgi:hypothetical protein